MHRSPSHAALALATVGFRCAARTRRADPIRRATRLMAERSRPDNSSRPANSSRRCRGPTRRRRSRRAASSHPNPPSASAPVCAPGFSLLLAPFVASVVPMRVLLYAGRGRVARLDDVRGWRARWPAPLAGAMAAVLVAVSPPVLYQVVQPMNDITTAALWMAMFVALLNRRWALAGVSLRYRAARPAEFAPARPRRRVVHCRQGKADLCRLLDSPSP